MNLLLAGVVCIGAACLIYVAQARVCSSATTCAECQSTHFCRFEAGQCVPTIVPQPAYECLAPPAAQLGAQRESEKMVEAAASKPATSQQPANTSTPTPQPTIVKPSQLAFDSDFLIVAPNGLAITAQSDSIHVKLAPVTEADSQRFSLSSTGLLKNRQTGRYFDEPDGEMKLRTADDMRTSGHDKLPYALVAASDGSGTFRICRQQDISKKWSVGCVTLRRDQPSSLLYQEFPRNELRDRWMIVKPH